MVRHNIDVPQPHTVVVLDVAPQRYPDDQFELAVDVAASVAVTSAKGHAPVQLRPTVGRTVGRPGRLSIDAIIEELTLIEPLSGGSLHRCLERVRLEANGTTLVIVTGQLHHLDIPAIVACRKRFNRVVVVNVGPMGLRPVPMTGIRSIPAPDLPSFADAWARTMGR
jgi:hypothetical protein